MSSSAPAVLVELARTAGAFSRDGTRTAYAELETAVALFMAQDASINPAVGRAIDGFAAALGARRSIADVRLAAEAICAAASATTGAHAPNDSAGSSVRRGSIGRWVRIGIAGGAGLVVLASVVALADRGGDSRIAQVNSAGARSDPKTAPRTLSSGAKDPCGLFEDTEASEVFALEVTPPERTGVVTGEEDSMGCSVSLGEGWISVTSVWGGDFGPSSFDGLKSIEREVRDVQGLGYPAYMAEGGWGRILRINLGEAVWAISTNKLPDVSEEENAIRLAQLMLDRRR